MSTSTTPAITTYTLFRRGTRRNPPDSCVTISFGMMFSEPKESWQQSNEGTSLNKEPKDTLEFVCHVKSPQEVAAAVRKAPLDEYVLFRGEMMSVKVAIPVFVDGKNLETLSAEWDVQNAE